MRVDLDESIERVLRSRQPAVVLASALVHHDSTEELNQELLIAAARRGREGGRREREGGRGGEL